MEEGGKGGNKWVLGCGASVREVHISCPLLGLLWERRWRYYPLGDRMGFSPLPRDGVSFLSLMEQGGTD